METLTTLKVLHVAATVVILVSGLVLAALTGVIAAKARPVRCAVHGCSSGV